jgi:hypothetical protein
MDSGRLQNQSLKEPAQADSELWATYLDQSQGQPARPVEDKMLAHTYWHGAYTAKPALAIKSFLATQNMQHAQVILWLDARTPEISPELEKLQNLGVQVRPFVFTVAMAGTPLEAQFTGLGEKSAGHEDWPEDRTASDLVRYAVLYKHGGLWFDSDVMFLRDLSPLFPFEFAYPWSKRHENGGGPQNHTLNAAMMRLFKGSDANKDMISRVAREHIPFGLWGLSSLRDNTKHPDLRVVAVEIFDPLWKDTSYFSETELTIFIRNMREKDPETNRFDWFFLNETATVSAGFHLLTKSNSHAYHWHNRWDLDAQLGSAFNIYEEYFNCALYQECRKASSPPLVKAIM